jgi:hypothetical protein
MLRAKNSLRRFWLLACYDHRRENAAYRIFGVAFHPIKADKLYRASLNHLSRDLNFLCFLAHPVHLL